MNICIAQTKSEKGNVHNNIQNHLKLIERAIEFNSDLIVFPELSITNYEPELANEIATSIEDNIFNPLQSLSDKNQITIGIGMPTKAPDGINISMLIFQPNKNKIVYSKRFLHSDELPYFVSSNNQPLIKINGLNIALGICYETLQKEHFIKAHESNADFYIASVAKPDRGTDKAYLYFPTTAKKFKTPILMCNSVGYSDNFISNGLSSAWNMKGELLAQLDNENQGLLIYDTETEQIKIDQPKVIKAKLSDLEELFEIYLKGKIELEKNSIFQWTDKYPTISIIENDLKNGFLYELKNNDKIIGAINISEEQETEYESIK